MKLELVKANKVESLSNVLGLLLIQFLMFVTIILALGSLMPQTIEELNLLLQILVLIVIIFIGMIIPHLLFGKKYRAYYIHIKEILEEEYKRRGLIKEND